MEVDSRPPLSPQMMEVDTPNYHQHHHGVGGGCGPLATQRRVQKRVSFADEALLYRSHRTMEDVQRMWYSKSELATLKSERKDIIRILKKVDFKLHKIDQDRICLRGYEAYFSVAMNKVTKYARELVLSVVFAEQNRQRMVGIFDPESLRERSCQASQWARDMAMELGFTDAQLNPLWVECLGRRQEDLDLTNGAQIRISTLDDNAVRQVESTLAMVKDMLRQCQR